MSSPVEARGFRHGKAWASAGWPLAIAFAWLWTWRHLALEWNNNPQYQYGFAIPFLASYIGVKRWKGHMQPSTGYGVWLLVAFAWLAFAVGELLRHQDPIWRLTGGSLALGSLLLTAGWLFRHGGGPLLRRERFALGFACLALPWPLPIELSLTQWLLHLVTGLSITVVRTMGIAALQHGNVIELANGYVGMANACSGVESLQSSTMACLFLGELFSLTISRRFQLLASGWGIAFASNLMRVLAVIFLVHKHGQPALSKYHDLVGSGSSATTFVSIFAIAAWFASKSPGRSKLPGDLEGRALRRRGEELNFAATLPPPRRRGSSALHGSAVPAPVVPIGSRLGWGVFAAFLLIPLLAMGWLKIVAGPETERPSAARWKLNSEALPDGWSAKPLQLSAPQRASLEFSTSDSLLITTPEGWNARLIHLFWEPEKSMPKMAFSHTPALCMSAQGWAQVAPPQAVELNFQGKRIPCVRYSLEQDETFQSVYQCLICGSKTEPFFIIPNHLGNRGDRLSMLWKGNPRQVSEELLLYMPTLGVPDLQDAAAERLLQSVLQPTQLD